MRPPPLLIVLFASALAIEDFERDGALGAPGPTHANLRGLKFGHSATEVEDEAAAGSFADTQDCADCPDCFVAGSADDGGVVDPSVVGYDFSNYLVCVCYVGPMKSYDPLLSPNDPNYRQASFQGTYYDDCIAITEFTNEVAGDKVYIFRIQALARGGIYREAVARLLRHGTDQWEVHACDLSGEDYYFNTISQTSRWTKPCELDMAIVPENRNALSRGKLGDIVKDATTADFGMGGAITDDIETVETSQEPYDARRPPPGKWITQ